MNHSPPLDAFARLESLGYGARLIPIIPPGAELNPHSRLRKALLKGADGRGKAPGVLWDGLWSGLNWLDVESTPNKHRLWAEMGAGVGIRTGAGLLAIDADIYDATWADVVETELRNEFGDLPKRVGQPPKAMYLLRLAEGSGVVSSFSFGDKQIVQFRYEGLQFVAYGVHPKTLELYRWTQRLVPYDELPIVTAEALERVVERLAAKLPGFQRTGTAGEGAERGLRDQEALRGATEEISRAVAAIPNSGRFDERKEWITMCCALRAALPDDPEGGLNAFKEFSARWAGGENDEDYVENTWRSLKRDTYEVGAGWIYDLANAEIGERRFGVAQWFESPDLEPAAPDEIGELDTFCNRELTDAPPEQEWHVHGWIPRGQTTILSGDGGTGKSLIALQLAIATDLEREWLGQKVTPGPVLFVTAEDDKPEIHRRQTAILRFYGASPSDLSDRLHTVSLHGKDAVLATIDSKNPMLLKATRLMQKLTRTMSRIRPVLLVLDTQADLFGGKENERAHARQFIGFLQRIAQAYNCAVLLLAHPSMSGMASGSGTSGVTAWSNSVRSRLYLRRQVDKEGDEQDPDFRALTVKKANRGRVGLSLGLRYRDGIFELAENSVEAVDLHSDDSVFLKLLKRANDNADWMSLAQNSKRYAPKAMTASDATAKKIGSVRLGEAMNRLLDGGVIAQEAYGPPSRPFYRLVIKDSGRITSSDTFDEVFW